MNKMQPWISRDVQATVERRYLAGHGSWPSKSHLTRTPNLWPEIAALRGEAGARPYGPWVGRSLQRAQARMAAETQRRVGRLAAALRQA